MKTTDGIRDGITNKNVNIFLNFQGAYYLSNSFLNVLCGSI